MIYLDSKLDSFIAASIKRLYLSIVPYTSLDTNAVCFRLHYLTMHDMDGHDTPILPSGERRQSNGNEYEVINDLLVPGNNT